MLAAPQFFFPCSSPTIHPRIPRFPAEYKIDIRRSDRFVINERVATAAGVTSGIDLALALVARLWGENLAARVAENIEWKY